jgi:hypothetical protein
MPGTFAHDRLQFPEERVFGVGAVEALVAITAADDQLRRLELGDFVLHRAQSQKAQAGQLARVKLLAGIGKEQSQYLCAHQREQSMEQCLFDASLLDRML